MRSQRWQDLDRLFHSALERPPEERSGFLAEACGTDEAVRQKVEALIAAHEQSGEFLDAPAFELAGLKLTHDRPSPLVNGILGHYKILGTLGAGGMGAVYLAKDKKLDRKVAVKILNDEFSQDESNLNRFIREAKAASSLNHPNILVIHEIGEYENTNYIVSEFIKGKTLREILKEKTLQLSEVLNISIQIADALCAAHSSNIIHRDIKPENIIVRPDGVVKVLDFGLAKLVEEKNRSIFGLEESSLQQSQTAKGVILGTVRYMSPEQARGKRVDARTDIFSFGILLYEMLTGEQPFTGETVNHTIVAILEKEPPPVSQFINSYPPEIERIIKKCLAKKADERYSAAKSLLDDLKELKEELAFQSKLKGSSAPNKRAAAEKQIIKAATAQNSIAILPFANMSNEAENEYFCDGLAEELLNALAKIEDLKVAARTSAFSFKNKNVEISDIGRTLNVKTVLEGSVRRSGNQLRISVQLVNAADGYHLWSERYDREMRDIFNVQDEITLAVVDALKVKLFGEEKAALLQRYTDNPEAYELYLKGLYYCYKWTDEGFQKSIEYFEKALEKDPEFAPVYAKIADYYQLSAHIGLFSPPEILPKWKAAAQRALEIDEGLADAHLAMAHIHFYYERDWAKAEHEFERAVELNPNSTYAHKHYGLFLASRERFDQAVAEGKKALALDPLSIAVNIVAGFIYLFVDRLDDALGLVRQMIELDSNSPQGYWLGGILLMANGEYEEAVETFQTSLRLGDNQVALAKLGCAYGFAGRRDEALKILDQLFEMRERRYAAPFNIARVYAGLGDNDNAFEWMEKAVEERNPELVFLKRFVEAGAGVYFGKNFSTDPRYDDILRRVGLPMPEKSQAQAATHSPAATSEKEISATIVPNEDAHKAQILKATTLAEIKQTTTNQTFANNPKAKYFAAGLLALILAVGGFFGYKYLSPTNKQIKSIAVLPFENKSSDADTDYLSDGLAESLIYRLSQLPDLKVSPTSSVFRYKGKETDAKKIADELGVDSVLTGRITQRGDSLTISVNLVDTRNGKSLWGEQYERKMSELLATQREIAAEITNNLKIKLSGESELKLAKKYTDNNEAYQLYLKGRYHFAKRTKEDILKGMENFKQAIKLDPNFALAYVEISDSYASMPAYPYLSPKEAGPQAKAAARKALEIDPSLAEAHTALGFSLVVFDWNWAEAEREFEKALQLNPNNSVAHYRHGFLYLTPLARHDEAITEINRAVELEPLSLITNANLAGAYMFAGQNDRALEQARKTYELEPNFVSGHYWLALAYIANGMYAEAIALGEKVLQTDSTSQYMLRVAGYSYAKSGRQREAEEIIKRFKDIAKTRYVMSYWVASIYGALGDKDKAFVELENAFAERDWDLHRLKIDPLMDPLRDDPRFQDLMRRIGLPQ